MFTGCTLALQAQDASLQTIETRLVDHRNKTLQEKIFVHTDKKTYLAGEFVWFKLYYVEGYTHQAIQLSRVAYVELLNEKNQPLAQAKISLKKGEENGSLYLPLNMPTGTYKLRAYTSWMKNFGPESFFEKSLAVINSLSNAVVQPALPDQKTYELSFFPEGGYLVKDIPGTLAFKGADAYGNGLSFKGWITDEKGDTITSFSPLKFGMGSVPFTPVGGHTYKAVAVFADGKRLQKELPLMQENGYAMHLQKAGNGQLKMEVRATSGSNASLVYLVAHTREIIKVAEGARLSNGQASFTIDPSRLDAGITQFTLFDAAQKPVAERLFFTQPKMDWKAEAQTDKKEYGPREKVALSLRTMNAVGTPSAANLSLSVFRTDPVQVPDNMNIENYLLLTSDLGGWVESPEYYFGNGAEQEAATDNLMLTQGWRRFRWQAVLDDGPFAATYPPEMSGQLVTGKVYSVRTNEPASGLSTFLSLPSKRYQVYFAKSNAQGQVQFELNERYGPGEMIAKPFAADDSLYRVELQNPFSTQYTRTLLLPLAFQDRTQQLLQNYSIGMQVRQVYAGDSLNQFNTPQPADSFSFLGVPDYTYNLDDYTRFTTMEEVLREYVRPINVSVRKGKPHMVFVNEADRTAKDENLLVMLDGVPIQDPDNIFAYDPLKVRKVEVFPRAFLLGHNYFFGVANFSTYQGSFDAFDLDPHLIALDYQGLQMQREFYAPAYETSAQKSSRIPDYRNTLYWNPEVHTSANGTASINFYSCDQKGHYLGMLQGMDTEGHLVVRQFEFDVK